MGDPTGIPALGAATAEAYLPTLVFLVAGFGLPTSPRDLAIEILPEASNISPKSLRNR